MERVKVIAPTLRAHFPLRAASQWCREVDEIRNYLERSLDREYDPTDDNGKPRTPRRRGLREVRVWHRDKLNTLLTQHDGIPSINVSLR
jgi:hypothetical protein